MIIFNGKSLKYAHILIIFGVVVGFGATLFSIKTTNPVNISEILSDHEAENIRGGMTAQTFTRPSAGAVVDGDNIRVTATLMSNYSSQPSQVITEVYSKDSLGGLDKAGWGVVALDGTGSGTYDYNTFIWPYNTTSNNLAVHDMVLKHCDPASGGVNCELNVDGTSQKNDIVIDHRIRVAEVRFWNVKDQFRPASMIPDYALELVDDKGAHSQTWRNSITVDKIFKQCGGSEKKIAQFRWAQGGTLNVAKGCSRMTNLIRYRGPFNDLYYSTNYALTNNEKPIFCADQYTNYQDIGYSSVGEGLLHIKDVLESHPLYSPNKIDVIFVNDIMSYDPVQSSRNQPFQSDYVLGMNSQRIIIIPDYFSASKTSDILAHELGHTFEVPHVDQTNFQVFQALDNCSLYTINRHLMCSTRQVISGNGNRYLAGQNNADCDRIFNSSQWQATSTCCSLDNN